MAEHDTDATQRNIAYYGTSREQPEAIALRAGPLELLYQAGDLRYIKLGEQEIIRRIYFAVRDDQWNTPAHTIERHTVESGGSSFRVYVIGHTRQHEVGVHWEVNISGESDGTITYRLRARAERTFLSNRTGLCLLHPAQECAGAPCRVTHTDGALEEGRFPERIAPHQPFLDMRAIAHQVQAGVWAHVTLEGDTFEMEDQRNWTDASFKTYSRPLALPMPVEIKMGQRVNQTITLRLEGITAETRPAPQRREAAPFTVSIGAATGHVLPPIGLSASTDAPPLNESQTDRLRALQLDHLRVALDGNTTKATLDRWAHDARALTLPLELALRDDRAVTLDRAAAWLRREQLTLARALLCSTPTTDTARWLAAAHVTLSDASLGVGVDGYFTNLNRERPDANHATLAFYSLNPQVHAFDNLSLVETLTTQAKTVRSARALYPEQAIAVTPITLRPRSNTAPDPRQPSLLGAGWTLGSIASLAAADVASLTYYQTVGDQGIMTDGADGLYPVYHLLRWLADWRGATVCAMTVSDPLRLQALALTHKDRLRLLLANTNGQPLQVALDGLGEKATAVWLEQGDIAAAQGGELGAPQNIRVRLGCACVPLAPYGLVCIDSDRTE